MVCGVSEVRPMGKVYLELELFRHNPRMAGAALVAALIKGTIEQREHILQCVQPEYLGVLEEYALAEIRERHREQKSLKKEDVFSSIAPRIDAAGGLTGWQHNWELIMSLDPSPWEVEKAIVVCRMVAGQRKLLLADTCHLTVTWAEVPPHTAGDQYVPPNVDLDLELFIHKRSLVADLVILSAAISAPATVKDSVFSRVSPTDLPFPIEAFLLSSATDLYREHGSVSPSEVESRLHEFLRDEDNAGFTRGSLAIWRIVLSLAPSTAQVEQAVALRLATTAALGV